MNNITLNGAEAQDFMTNAKSDPNDVFCRVCDLEKPANQHPNNEYCSKECWKAEYQEPKASWSEPEPQDYPTYRFDWR